MNKRLIAVAASILAVGGITYAVAAGSFQTLPQVALQSYCAAFVTGIGSSNAPYLQPPGSTQGTTTSICQVQVPAGPTILSGQEVIPADTTAASNLYTGLQGPLGQPPSTVAIPVILLDSGAYTYSAPNATRANFTIVNPSNWLILDGTATAFSQINVQLPGTVNQPALNGQQFHIVSVTSITTLGIVGQTTSAGAAAVTVSNAPVTLAIGSQGSGPTPQAAVSFIYDSTISTWFRTQ